MSSVLYNQACTTVQRVQWYKNHEATIPEKHFQCDGATLDSPPPPLATDREPRGLPATSLLPRSSPEKFPEQYERAESESEKEREGERERRVAAATALRAFYSSVSLLELWKSVRGEGRKLRRV